MKRKPTVKPDWSGLMNDICSFRFGQFSQRLKKVKSNDRSKPQLSDIKIQGKVCWVFFSLFLFSLFKSLKFLLDYTYSSFTTQRKKLPRMTSFLRSKKAWNWGMWRPMTVANPCYLVSFSKNKIIIVKRKGIFEIFHFQTLDVSDGNRPKKKG